MRNVYAIWDRADVRPAPLAGAPQCRTAADRHRWYLPRVRCAQVLPRPQPGKCAIGLCFITGKGLRVGVWLLGVQMLGALSPLLLFPGEMFSGPYHAPSLEGQYVIKDVVLIAAGLVIAATVQGGRLVTGPKGRPRDMQTIPRQIPIEGVPGAAPRRIARR